VTKAQQRQQQVHRQYQVLLLCVACSRHGWLSAAAAMLQEQYLSLRIVQSLCLLLLLLLLLLGTVRGCCKDTLPA
jgi:hypothetical protein